MSIKKNNTYFKENDGKVYYFDENGVKKEVPSTAFSNLQEQIDAIGKPLTYSGSKSVTEINELETIKIGTVYTITGTSGTITAGNIDVIKGDEIAWGGEPAQWFNIGKDKVDSWKTWSEVHGSTGTNDGVYIGTNNSSDKGSFVFGQQSTGDTGATVIGKSSYGKLGFKSIGEANKGSQGGGAFGNSNIAGKGGYIIGDNNISRKYEIINPTDPSTSSINYETTEIDNFWSQNVFGLYNYTQYKKNGGRSHGMPFQFGFNNIVQDEITWTSDYDIDTARTYQNGGSYIGTFNIGTNNSAFDTGINIGYKNTILIGDESGASINIGKGNINRMGIIIGQDNVTYDTMTSTSSTYNKSNAYSWILGQSNSANGASVAIGKEIKAQQGSYAFGGGGIQSYSGSMSIGLGSLYTECGSIAIGKDATAYSGSLAIGCGGLYASSGSFAFGNSVTSYRGSIGIGKNGVYVADDGYALGEFVTAGSNAVAIGLTVYSTGHGYAFGNQVTGQYAGIAVGFDGVTAGGQGASFGYCGTYSNGGSITLGHNGATSDATAVALGSNDIYSNFKSIVLGQFGVTATSAGLSIGNESVYSTDRAIAIGKYDVGARGWGSFAIGIKGITADNTSWSIGYGGYGGSNYLSAHISATNESFAIGQSGISAVNNSFSIGRKHLFATNESFVLGNKNIFAHDNSFNIGITGANTTEPYSNLTGNWDYGTWSNSFAIGLGRNVAHNGSFVLGIHNNYGISNMNLPYSADYNSIMLAVGNGLSSRTLQDSVSIASYGLYDGLTGKSTVEYQSLLLDHQVLGEVEVRNKSIMIGGPSFCQFHFNDVYSALSANVKEGSAKADHASIVLGYNNIADGGVFAIGSNNTACDLYGRQSAWTQFTQATIFGDYNRVINYRGYLYVPGVKEGQFSQSAFTRNAIIGTNNSISGWNNFIFGTNNSAGIEEYAIHYPGDDSPAYNDDGFTLAFGLNNRAARNYDMAIGYAVTASGGENIAIGSKQTDKYGYLSYYTQAQGYKNIAIRSNITGIGNISIDTKLTGNIVGVFDNSSYRQKINDNNKYYNSILEFNTNSNSEDHWNVSKNIIDNANLTATVNSFFVHNNIIDLQDGIFSGSLTHNDLIHNKNLILKTRYTSDGIEENLFYHTTDLSAEVDEFSHNIFSHIQGNVLAQQSHNNLLFNSNVNVSADSGEYRGFSNNFLQNSTVTGVFNGLSDCLIFDSTANFNNSAWGANNSDVLFYSHYITNTSNYQLPSNSVVGYTVKEGEGQNFLFGTMGINLHSVFSFSDRYGLNKNPYSLPTEEPYLMNCSRVYNFGDNSIINAANIDCAGEANFVQGIKVANINGNYNFIVSDYDSDASDFLNIYGQSNTIIVSGVTQNTIGYNTIIGSNNNINATTSGGNYDSSTVRNIILGSENSYHSVRTTSFGNFTNLVNFYGYTNNNIGSYYDDLPAGDRYIGKPLEFTNRNIIVGQHSVISDAINDSVIVGSNNLIYNSVFETKGSNFLETDVVSNNFVLGSYNLLKDGSNQINIGVGNNTSGYNATAIGEGLIAKTSQMVVGRFNAELDGTNGLSANGVDNTSGALFIVGNGYHKNNDYESTGCVRSNAMIVSADGTVSARRFVEAEPALTITGGDFVTVTEDQQNNLLTIDLETSLGQMITELSGVLTAKPSTGRHILGVDNGTLTWLEVNQ